MRRRQRRLLAAVLALSLLLAAGCAQTPAEETWAIQDKFDPLEDPIFDVLDNALNSGSAVPLQTGERNALVPFSEMVYTRPDAAEQTERLYQIAAAVRESADAPGAAVILLREAGQIWDDFLTAQNLAMIHYDINTRDAYWAEEYNYCASAAGALRMALAHVQGSAAAVRGEAATSSAAFDQEQYLALQEQEQALLSEYNDICNNAYTVYNGQTIYYTDGMASDAALAWIEAFAPRLSEIYAELVRVRNGIAGCFGYANYAEYYFSSKSYSVDMVRTLIDALRTYWAPLYREELDSYETPDLRVEAAQAISFMRTIFAQLDAQLTDSLDLMEAYQLSSLDESPVKASDAFTTFLPNYGAPFIFMRYDGTYRSFTTLLHEFGHFNDLYRNEAAVYESPEISEVFSTALVLLSSDRYDLVMDADSAALCKYSELTRLLLLTLEQGALLQLEMQAYTAPEGSLHMNSLCDMAQSAWVGMGLPDGPTARYSWMRTSHLYEAPFYVLSYVVSSDVALQLWELDGRDPAAGFAKYNDLLQAAMDKDSDFLQIVEGSGLASPFSVAEVARLADVLGAQLDVLPEILQVLPETLPDAEAQEAPEAVVLPDAVPIPDGA